MMRTLVVETPLQARWGEVDGILSLLFLHRSRIFVPAMPRALCPAVCSGGIKPCTSTTSLRCACFPLSHSLFLVSRDSRDSIQTVGSVENGGAGNQGWSVHPAPQIRTVAQHTVPRQQQQQQQHTVPLSVGTNPFPSEVRV
jgi:hypothetical protein